MSSWPGKYVIGLTGNIATGKSVVRKMLEHLGAYGIDADALAHRAISPDAPGYKPVLDTFGRWILGPDKQIDRAKLGRIVFSDPEAMRRLEAVVHPLVQQAVDLLIRRSKQKVVVIEAIKLLETGMRSQCDALWVTYAPPHVQLERLLRRRKLSELVARQRIAAQSPQEAKIGAADVVIRNDATFESTWKQVLAAWQISFPTEEIEPVDTLVPDRGKIAVQRAGPRQADEIAQFITRMSNGALIFSREDVMESFGEKAFLLLRMDGLLRGLAGWQVENLVARIDDIYIDPELSFGQAVVSLTTEVENASRELQCEIALLFLTEEMGRNDSELRRQGYQLRTIESLKVRAWQEAAAESMPAGSLMFFKQLRKDRVLRPV